MVAIWPFLKLLARKKNDLAIRQFLNVDKNIIFFKPDLAFIENGQLFNFFGPGIPGFDICVKSPGSWRGVSGLFAKKKFYGLLHSVCNYVTSISN